MARLYGKGMGQEHVIIHLRPETVALPRIPGLDIHPFIHPDHQVLLIVDLPVHHLVTKFTEYDSGIPLKGSHTLPGFPAIVFFHQGIGKVKVIQGHKGFNALFQKTVNDLVVEPDSILIHIPVPIRYDPGPGHGKAVHLKPQFLHQPDVLPPAVIKITGRPGVCLDTGTPEGIVIRHGHAFLPLIPSALYLECGGGCAPEEMFRE